MERLTPETSKLISPYAWPLYKADSLADMINSKGEVANELKTVSLEWLAGLNWKDRLDHTILSFMNLFYPGTFTYLALKKIPQVEIAPRTLVVLPKVQYYPAQDEPNKYSDIRVGDITETVDLEFPYGITAYIGKSIGFEADRKTLRETSWSGPVILLNIYGPFPHSFLMHVFNIKAREKAEKRLKQFAPKLSFNPQMVSETV